MSNLTVHMKVLRNELKPTKNNDTDACWDLRADLSATPVGRITLFPFQRKRIPTGVFVELPAGFSTRVMPRSGLADKHGITILNSPGVIDVEYRGEIMIILYNSDPNMKFVIEDCDRIAQMNFVADVPTTIKYVDVISETKRGTNGFGSSGVK